MSALEQIKNFFRQQKHTQMERTSATIMILSAAFIVVIALGSKNVMDLKNSEMTDNALYTTSFISSKSGVTGSVINVYSDPDSKKAFLLFKISDPLAMPTDANDYDYFLTGSDLNQSYTPINYDPDVALYSFGDSGYMGFYLVEADGFDNQILRLILRNQRPILDSDQVYLTDETINEQTFAEKDQIQIFFNPGGQRTVKIPALAQDGAPDVAALYAQTVTASSEQNVRQNLENNLASMKTSLALIKEYRTRLEQNGVVVPENPAIIGSDEIVMEGEEGQQVPVLKTETVYSNGYDFDWRNGSIAQGYLAAVKGDSDMSDAQFLLKKASEKSKEFDFSAENLTWMMQDGSLVEDLKDGSKGMDEYDRIKKLIDNLNQQWTSYIKQKQEYQTVNLPKLLQLEEQAKSIAGQVTINALERDN